MYLCFFEKALAFHEILNMNNGATVALNWTSIRLWCISLHVTTQTNAVCSI